MSSRHEAEDLAAAIRDYWKAQGRSPKVWTEQQYASASGTDERLHWVVRSDMVGGWPSKAGPAAIPVPVPPTPVKLAGAAQSDSANALARLSGVPYAGKPIESPGFSYRVWRYVGAARG